MTAALAGIRIGGHLRRAPALVIAAYGLSKGLQLMVAVLIARTLSRDLAGTAFYVSGLIAFNQVVAPLGLDAFASYAYPRFTRTAATHRARAYVALALLVALPVSLVASIPILFEEPGRAASQGLFLVFAAAFCSACSVLRRLARTILLAEGKRTLAIVHDSAGLSLFTCVLLLMPGATDLVALGALLSVAHGGAALWAALDLKRALAPSPAGRLMPRWRSSRVLLRLALPSLVAQAGAQLLNRADVLILAPLSTPAAVADYGAALRVTFLLQGIVELTNFVHGKQILALGRDPPGRRRYLAGRLLRRTAALTLACALPILLCPENVLRLLFGEAYAGAALPLRLLVLGKLLTAPFGPLLSAFVVLGHNRAMAGAVAFAAACNIAADLVLIPAHGAAGAAAASLIGLIAMFAAHALIYRRAFALPPRP